MLFTLYLTHCLPLFTGRTDLEGAPRCAASRVELFTTGGEVGFVSRLIDESLVLRGRVRWYACAFSSTTNLFVSP